jgi:RsiW-degrading membrane proteinase PrsW (M82 family)/pSer/pThr/pTyr-binding forkhead associated (FHA) protein
MKLIVTVQTGSLTGNAFSVIEGFLTIGRGGNCNILFDPMAENMVSTKHAYIETKPDGFYLIDTKSTNGTFVNGNRVQIVKLNSGDIVQFGKNGPQVSVMLDLHDSIATQDNQAAFNPPMVQQIPTNPPANFNNQFQSPAMSQGFGTPQFTPPMPNAQKSVSYIGLSNPVIKVEEKSSSKKYIGAAIGILFFGFLGLVAMLLIGFSVGLIPAIVASLIAFIPPIIYILPLIFLDRYDPEPPWLIASAFAWGGIVAVVFSFIVNTTFGVIVGEATHDAEISSFVTAVVSAPIFEELSKGIGVVILLIFFRREFDDILDGIVYGGVIGLGFATVENVLYYGNGINAGSDTLVAMLIVRGIASPFIHSTFTAMTGIGCGISRESHNKVVRFIAPIGGYIIAVILHAIWNGIIATILPSILFKFGFGKLSFWISYFVLAVPFFFIFAGFCIFIMRRQNKILNEMLAIDVARGLISQEQLKTVTSAFKSTAWLAGGLASGKFKARSRFQRAVGKLGLSYWHIQRATAAQGQTGSFQQNPILRAEVEKWRDQV